MDEIKPYYDLLTINRIFLKLGGLDSKPSWAGYGPRAVDCPCF